MESSSLGESDSGDDSDCQWLRPKPSKSSSSSSSVESLFIDARSGDVSGEPYAGFPVDTVRPDEDEDEVDGIQLCARDDGDMVDERLGQVLMYHA